ncbi:hypothetical protein VTN77DRAFT_7616 [Rasamsonia byssochlamydoides]|uniref:uncharacterized protein n=1 Tax=Rasamsonia byssochlamydoides TaxID=89139 RepID=UPI00374374A4
MAGPEQREGAADSTAEEAPACEKSVNPNSMVFFDKDGVRHQIYMPKGSFEYACELAEAEDWDTLAKFPVWENQNYDDWERDDVSKTNPEWWTKLLQKKNN